MNRAELQRMTPLVNGKPVPFRIYTEAELAPKRAEQQRFLDLWLKQGKPKGWLPNTARQMWVEILVPCKPGDDLTFDHHPPEYDQLWARFPLVDGNKGSMVLSGRNPALDLRDPTR